MEIGQTVAEIYSRPQNCGTTRKGEAESPSNTMSPGPRPTSVPINWYPDPSSRLATIDMVRKVGAGASVPLSVGELGPI